MFACKNRRRCMNELTLLHLSDLHTRVNEIAEFKIRRDALLKDLHQLKIRPDMVLISGDVAFSGESKEYEIAQEEFVTPLINDLRIKAGHLVIIPGNHDISRPLIDPFVADGISARLSDTETAQTLLAHKTWILPLQACYMQFLRSIRGMDAELPFYAQIVRLDRISIGIAAFDSAWLCLNDATMNRLFLTRRQVQELAEQVKGCAFKVALIHHPLTWFHPSEQEIVQQDLRASFDLILTGHMHEPVSFSKVTPSTACLEITAASFFAGTPRGSTDGYNIYSVDPTAGKLRARFRAFIRGRSSYDRNVDHAPDGEFCFNLPTSAFADQTKFALARRVTEVNTALSLKISDSLKKVQHLDPPILLTAPAQEMKWEKTGRKYSPLRDPYQFCTENTCILYSPPDAGSTVFLQDLCQRLNTKEHTAFYVNHSEIQDIRSSEKMLQKLCKKFNLNETDLQNENLTLVVDHVVETDPDHVSRLLGFRDVIPHLVVCVKNDIFFDSLAALLSRENVRFLRLRYWGPSRLREFTVKYIEASGMSLDPDAAVKFIWDSLSLCDLPVTPFLVALYLRVFFEFGGKITSISFVRLLERLEESSLDQAEASTNYSIYNLRLMLMWLAAACYKSATLGISRKEYEAHITNYFNDRALDVDATKFVQLLETSGIIATDTDGIVFFTCIVFFNYYLAQAIEAHEIDLEGHLQSLHTALRLGDALAYYAGRHRDEEHLTQELMRCLEEEYSSPGELTSADLEKYIGHLLNPETEGEKKDEVAKKAIESQIDYGKADEGFERDQVRSRAIGKGLVRVAPPKSKIEKVAWNIIALKTFYNVFRNLEHIPAEAKKKLLDRILDYHLRCNMDLIDLFSQAMEDDQFTSLCAYMVTIGGEDFLSQNVGSASLQRTIEELLQTTKNDLKLFLLLCIYADLRLPGYAGRLEAFLSDSENISILEMGYAKVYDLLVRYEGKNLPASLISAFNCAFDRRQRYYGRMPPINLQRLRDKALNEAKKQFLMARKDQSNK
jgi:predicted MPP superfamily phosphohydrolase